MEWTTIGVAAVSATGAPAVTPPLALTVPEAAALIGMTPGQLYHHIRSGALEREGIAVRHIGRTIRIPRVPFERWAAGLPPYPPDPPYPPAEA